MPAFAVNGQRRLGPALAIALGCVAAVGTAASVAFAQIGTDWLRISLVAQVIVVAALAIVLARQIVTLRRTQGSLRRRRAASRAGRSSVKATSRPRATRRFRRECSPQADGRFRRRPWRGPRRPCGPRAAAARRRARRREGRGTTSSCLCSTCRSIDGGPASRAGHAGSLRSGDPRRRRGAVRLSPATEPRTRGESSCRLAAPNAWRGPARSFAHRVLAHDRRRMCSPRDG